MQDADLFMELAAIAGVFVGFGALIAVRSGGPSDPFDVAPVRGVVVYGTLTIVAALAPVTLGRYDLTEHEVLALSSVLVLAGTTGLLTYHRMTAESRAVAAAIRTRRFQVVENAATLLLNGGSAFALVVIVLGLAPDLEAALYFTVAVLGLVLAAWVLLWLVFMERRPASA